MVKKREGAKGIEDGNQAARGVGREGAKIPQKRRQRWVDCSAVSGGSRRRGRDCKVKQLEASTHDGAARAAARARDGQADKVKNCM